MLHQRLLLIASLAISTVALPVQQGNAELSNVDDSVVSAIPESAIFQAPEGESSLQHIEVQDPSITEVAEEDADAELAAEEEVDAEIAEDEEFGAEPAADEEFDVELAEDEEFDAALAKDEETSGINIRDQTPPADEARNADADELSASTLEARQLTWIKKPTYPKKPVHKAPGKRDSAPDAEASLDQRGLKHLPSYLHHKTSSSQQKAEVPRDLEAEDGQIAKRGNKKTGYKFGSRGNKKTGYKFGSRGNKKTGYKFGSRSNKKTGYKFGTRGNKKTGYKFGSRGNKKTGYQFGGRSVE